MSATGGGSAPAPNWYPDPSDPRFLRYWDGRQWTEHTSPVSGAAAGAPQGGVAPSGGGSKKTLLIVLAVVLGVIILIGIVAAITIPVFLSQRQKAEYTAAKADVALLGKEIATWYVDHDGPPPEVVLLDGEYFVDGVDVGPAFANVELGGVTGTRTTNWCVWVTNPKGFEKDHEYSADGGLRSGTC